MSRPTLRPYQNDALDAVAKAVQDGNNRLLIKKPTGTGKTVMFAELPRRLRAWLEQFPKGQRKMLVIAHREELLDQAVEKIRKNMPGAMVSIEQGDRHANRYCDVIVASIQTLAAMKFRRLKDLMRFSDFRLVVIDEAHHAAAATYRTALVHLGFLPAADASDKENIEAATETDAVEMAKHLAQWDAVAPKDRILVGVTATPNRTDAVGLGCVFQDIVYNYSLKQAIADGYLVPIVPWCVETTVSLDAVKTTAGEFNQRDLADTVNTPHRNALAVEAWVTYAADRQTLVFAVDVDHARMLTEAFQVVGIKAEYVTGETPKDERRRLLEDFRRGRIQVLCNCMVLTEGTDLPMVSCILNAKPTKSATLYEQMIGRGLRVHPDDPVGPERAAAAADALKKRDCIVLDVVDVARRHSLQTAPVLYGLPPNVDPKGKELAEFDRQMAGVLEKYPALDVAGMGRTTLEALQVRASTFDIWQVPELGAIGAGLTLQWIKVGERYRLQYNWQGGTETVTVEPNLVGKYDIVCTLRPPPAPGTHISAVRQRTLATGYETARQALEVAEAFVRNDRAVVVGMKRKNAGWRSHKASEKQIALLRRLRAPIRPGLTAGEASDLIDTALARRAR